MRHVIIYAARESGKREVVVYPHRQACINAFDKIMNTGRIEMTAGGSIPVDAASMCEVVKEYRRKEAVYGA